MLPSGGEASKFLKSSENLLKSFLTDIWSLVESIVHDDLWLKGMYGEYLPTRNKIMPALHIPTHLITVAVSFDLIVIDVVILYFKFSDWYR